MLGISARGSNAAQTPQPAAAWREDTGKRQRVQISSGGPSLCSGFRRAAPTPRERLNLPSFRAKVAGGDKEFKAHGSDLPSAKPRL